jgi:tRNA(Ser,Leu) C12 N-acetylase TAN1
VARTRYYNVLAMTVDDISTFMETLSDWMVNFPDTAESIARTAPVRETFTFQTASDFEDRVRECLRKFIPQLAGRRFHLRLHRRGWKDKLVHQNEEQFLGGLLVGELERTGTPAEVDFHDPEFIVAVEALDNRAGVALWSRDDLQRYPFLKLD